MKKQPKFNPTKAKKSMREANRIVDQRAATQHDERAEILRQRRRALREAKRKPK